MARTTSELDRLLSLARLQQERLTRELEATQAHIRQLEGERQEAAVYDLAYLAGDTDKARIRTALAWARRFGGVRSRGPEYRNDQLARVAYFDHSDMPAAEAFVTRLREQGMLVAWEGTTFRSIAVLPSAWPAKRTRAYDLELYDAPAYEAVAL